MSYPKEPFYFESEYNKEIEFYKSTYFSHWCGEPVIGEARHRNLYLPWVPDRIHATNPNAKLLVILRDPVERAYSHWWHNYIRGDDPLPFEDAVERDIERIRLGLTYETDEEIQLHSKALYAPSGRPHGIGLYRTYIDSGHYAEQLQRYLDLFPSAQIMTMFLDDLQYDPQSLITHIIRFLDINKFHNYFTKPIYMNVVSQQSRFGAEQVITGKLRARRICRQLKLHRIVPRSLRSRFRRDLRNLPRPEMAPTVRQRLRAYYETHDRNLESLLGRKVPWKVNSRTKKEKVVHQVAIGGR